MITDGSQQSSQRQSYSAVSGFGLKSNKDDVVVLPGKSSKPKQLCQNFLICSFVQTLPVRECWPSRFPQTQGEGNRSRRIKISKHSLYFLAVAIFLEWGSLIPLSFGLRSRALERLIFDNHCQFPHSFQKNRFSENRSTPSEVILRLLILIPK